MPASAPTFGVHSMRTYVHRTAGRCDQALAHRAPGPARLGRADYWYTRLRSHKEQADISRASHVILGESHPSFPRPFGRGIETHLMCCGRVLLAQPDSEAPSHLFRLISSLPIENHGNVNPTVKTKLCCIQFFDEPYVACTIM